jgi:hypothetical protein
MNSGKTPNVHVVVVVSHDGAVAGEQGFCVEDDSVVFSKSMGSTFDVLVGAKCGTGYVRYNSWGDEKVETKETRHKRYKRNKRDERDEMRRRVGERR